jgi:DNA-directed RNA polymerase specialized sigma subunit
MDVIIMEKIVVKRKPGKKDVPDIEYQPEMTFAEIARDLGVSEQAVMEVYYRAIYKLVKMVKL